MQNYHNDELRGLYLGCKTDEAIEKEFVALAVAKNPNVQIFKMKMDAASYNLTPVRVDTKNYL